MRISDWSSDVCSSDLTGGGDGEGTDSPEFAGFVARQAGLALDVAERGIRGTRYKVPRFIADGLRTSPKFRAALAELSEATGRPVAELFREARPLMNEVIDRKSGGSGKSVVVGVDLGGSRHSKNKK